MDREVYYKFFHDNRLLDEGKLAAPFTVGRQSGASESDPVSVVEIPRNSTRFHQNADSPRKLVIVPLSDRSVPRLSVRVDVDEAGNMVIHNIHRAYDLELNNRQMIRSNEQACIGHEGAICFGGLYKLSLAQRPARPPKQWTVPTQAGNQSIMALDYASDAGEVDSTCMLSMMIDSQPLGRKELAVGLVRTALEAFKEPPGSEEFFAAAGRAAIKMVDLDRVAVLRKEAGNWVCSSQAVRPGLNREREERRPFSQTLLSAMEKNGKTIIVEPQFSAEDMIVSMKGVDRAVASPIFDQSRSVVGALYGDRSLGGLGSDRPIGELEAALLEVLATGISSSLAIQHEQRLRGSMSQFFSPVVLSQLALDSTLLNGRETNVSVLFCNIRGFSTVTERIGPAESIKWINDVLTRLSECVLKYDGVLVDYVGDELMAMWGAPIDQVDHAERACRAALEMLGQVGPIVNRWSRVLPEKFGFGVGISSGLASVGNTGSKKKFKYGPMGNTVNLASRVQGITKQIGVPALITEATLVAARSASLQTRRLAKVRVIGIETPIDLFQLLPDTSQRDLCTRYEQALEAFEQHDLERATGCLASLVQDYPTDWPTIILLNRTVECLTQVDRRFDPIWNLKQK